MISLYLNSPKDLPAKRILICKVMLLHSDVFLNEGAEPRVGVGDLDWVGVGCHRLYCFNIGVWLGVINN